MYYFEIKDICKNLYWSILRVEHFTRWHRACNIFWWCGIWISELLSSPQVSLKLKYGIYCIPINNTLRVHFLSNWNHSMTLYIFKHSNHFSIFWLNIYVNIATTIPSLQKSTTREIILLIVIKLDVMNRSSIRKSD